MATVEIPTRMRSRTGGLERVKTTATTVRQLLDELEARFPGLREEIVQTAAIAIDGEIVADSARDALVISIADAEEIILVPAISGG